jgi:hypothetical protein
MAAMDVLAQPFRAALTRALWALQWFAREFLWIAIRPNASAILMSICRLLGVAAIVAVLLLLPFSGLAPAFLGAACELVFVGLVAIFVGNLVKEMAVELSARAMAMWGRDFTRVGATLDGKIVRETLRCDGTWIRCVTSEEGTVCEWTDRHGGCYQVTTASRVRPRARV